MLGLTLDPRSDESIVDQLTGALRDRIRERQLVAGERLPSSRALAAALGVHRNTVTTVYRCLVDEGWLESQVGRGTFVGEDLPEGEGAVESRFASGTSFDWSPWRTGHGPTPGDEMAEAYGTPQLADTISFAGGVPDPDLYPADEVRRLGRELLRGDDTLLFRYGPAAGYEPLRELLAAEAVRDGVVSGEHEVLITNGSSQGLDLFLRFATEPGRIGVATVPCYPGALHLFEVHGVRCRSVPIESNGLDLGQLEQALAGERPRFLHLIPRFQNPTGLTLSTLERQRVLALAARYRVPIFEDDYGPGLRFEGSEPPTLLALASSGGVIQSGTLSKIAFPGFRIGWLFVPRAIFGDLHEIKRCSDLGGSLFPQMVVYEFWRRGGLARHVKKVRREYGRRRDALLEALDREMPDEVRWSEPQGGLVLWLSLPEGLDSLELLPTAARAGVTYAPGAFFYPGGAGPAGLRMSFGGVPAERIAEGVRRLSVVLREASRTAGRRKARRSASDSSLAV